MKKSASVLLALCIIMLLLMFLLSACAERDIEISNKDNYHDNVASSDLPDVSSESKNVSSEKIYENDTTQNSIASPSSSIDSPAEESENKYENDTTQNSMESSSSIGSSTVESGESNSFSITVIYDDASGTHSEKTISDKNTVDTVIKYFSELTDSPIVMTPKVGDIVITVSINNKGNTKTFKLNSPARDGTLYCKDILVNDWVSMTGWSVIPDADAYDYLINLFNISVQ